jgi:hypothetical protein
VVPAKGAVERVLATAMRPVADEFGPDEFGEGPLAGSLVPTGLQAMLDPPAPTRPLRWRPATPQA